VNELKPCPFCANKDILISHYKKDGIQIRCSNCGVMFQQRVMRKSIEWLQERLIEDWNSRQALKEVEEIK
jgi:Zn ribbon nucleic-acid-binding protein